MSIHQICRNRYRDILPCISSNCSIMFVLRWFESGSIEDGRLQHWWIYQRQSHLDQQRWPDQWTDSCKVYRCSRTPSEYDCRFLANDRSGGGGIDCYAMRSGRGSQGKHQLFRIEDEFVSKNVRTVLFVSRVRWTCRKGGLTRVSSTAPRHRSCPVLVLGYRHRGIVAVGCRDRGVVPVGCLNLSEKAFLPSHSVTISGLNICSLTSRLSASRILHLVGPCRSYWCLIVSTRMIFGEIFFVFQPKCDRYWPEKKGEEAEYGPFKVRLVDEQRLEQLEEKTFKRELQVIFSPFFIYISVISDCRWWTMESVEPFINYIIMNGLITVVQRVNNTYWAWSMWYTRYTLIRISPFLYIAGMWHKNKYRGYTKINFSAGCGRTGTIIAANILYERMKFSVGCFHFDRIYFFLLFRQWPKSIYTPW